MASFAYMKLPSTEQGKNVKIRVWKLKNNEPSYIGEQHHNTKSWRGKQAIANEIIAENEGYRFDGYHLERKDVRVFQLQTGEI